MTWPAFACWRLSTRKLARMSRAPFRFFAYCDNLIRNVSRLAARGNGGNDRDGNDRRSATDSRRAASESAVHHRRLVGRYADRVVRFLSLRRAGGLLQQAFLFARDGSDARFDREPFRVLDRVP